LTEHPPKVDVSVVIPAKNAAPFLPEQLDALTGQEGAGHFEVIVADNGSTDDTRTVALSFADRVPGLRVVDAAARPGSAHARNVGVASSQGRFLVFADADDVVDRRYVGAMAAGLRHHAAVAARIDWTMLNTWSTGRALPTDQGAGVSGGFFGWLPFAFGGAFGIRRATFEMVGGFDATIARADDVELCWRLGLAGVPLSFVPEAVVHYRLRPGVRTTFRQGRANGRDGARLYAMYRAKGMPRHTWRTAIRFWLGALAACGRSRSRQDAIRCAGLIGLRVGIVEGSIRHRALYF
jgi:glycosyltransferase involved in cell wall biosynthesis